jgi:hypothetical protein
MSVEVLNLLLHIAGVKHEIALQHCHLLPGDIVFEAYYAPWG